MKSDSSKAAARGVEVQIFGKVYHLRSFRDPAHTRRVAQLVDETMNQIADQATSSDSYRTAVLAALHLADQFLSAQEDFDRLQSDVSLQSDRISALLEQTDPLSEEESSFSAAAD